MSTAMVGAYPGRGPRGPPPHPHKEGTVATRVLVSPQENGLRTLTFVPGRRTMLAPLEVRSVSRGNLKEQVIEVLGTINASRTLLGPPVP